MVHKRFLHERYGIALYQTTKFQIDSVTCFLEIDNYTRKEIKTKQVSETKTKHIHCINNVLWIGPYM